MMYRENVSNERTHHVHTFSIPCIFFLATSFLDIASVVVQRMFFKPNK